MELSELKSIWNQLDVVYVRQTPRKSLAATLRAQHRHIAHMKRNLLSELIMIAILYGSISVFYFVAFDGRFAALSFFTLMVALFYSIYLYKKYRLLSHRQQPNKNVHSNIKAKIRSLETFTRFYLISGTLLVAVSLLFIFFLFYLNNPAPSSSIFYISEGGFTTALLIWLVITAIVTTGMYFVNAWYIKKLYGKHIKAMKDLLSDFEVES
jgi:hypothetical protein